MRICYNQFGSNTGAFSHIHNVVQSKGDAAKYKDYFDFNESITTIPSHRILALFRGRQASHLQIKVGFSDDQDAQYCIVKFMRLLICNHCLKIIG